MSLPAEKRKEHRPVWGGPTTLPILSDARIRAYLRRLGNPAVQLNRDGLSALQAAHLMNVPFHNLLLLANDGRPRALQPLVEVVDDAIAGIGGNCDRTSPPFAVLLQSLGFDVHFAAATVRATGDHFVCIVETEGQRYLCDVGNGHPYLRPWILDGGPQEQNFHGWRFRFDPQATGGPRLTRQLEDGGSKTVYVVEPGPRRYEEFAQIVLAHYTEATFGPFLTGLRAVRIEASEVLTLRDDEYARDTPFGRFLRPILRRGELVELLVNRFRLSRGLVDDALVVLTQRRPELFREEPAWVRLGRGGIDESVGEQRPARSEVPDVLVSLATTGRDSSVTRLLQTLSAEILESGYPGRVGVLLVDNRAESRDANPPRFGNELGFVVRCVPASQAAEALDRSARIGLLPDFRGVMPLPIGAAREAQIGILRAHLDKPIRGLPHPSEHPTVVWMMDDDLAFLQLGTDGVIRRRTNLLFRVARFWATLPQHSVVLGAFTGDPPVPGIDSLGGQLRDLRDSLNRMLALGPSADWTPRSTPTRRVDAYYDLSEAVGSDDTELWPFAPNARSSVRAVTLLLLRDLRRLSDGQQVTRPLVWDGDEIEPQASLRRGGNAVFLDLDYLFRWPTPVVDCGDGVMTRRADTLWAALAQSEEPNVVVEATLPLLHDREGQGRERRKLIDPGHASLEASAQVRGVALARAIAEGRDLKKELRAREDRVTEQRMFVRARLAELRREMKRLDAWNDGEVDQAVAGADEALEVLDVFVSQSSPFRGDPGPLQGFLSNLPATVFEWREGWR